MGEPGLAAELKTAFEALSPLIEGYTQALCPLCESVCCIDRHGAYEEDDMAFLSALGEGMAEEAPRGRDTEPCRYLNVRGPGCSLPRWKRPFRCTWYFCQRLLEAMPENGPRQYREMVGALQRLVSLRQQVTGGSQLPMQRIS